MKLLSADEEGSREAGENTKKGNHHYFMEFFQTDLTDKIFDVWSGATRRCEVGGELDIPNGEIVGESECFHKKSQMPLASELGPDTERSECAKGINKRYLNGVETLTVER